MNHVNLRHMKVDCEVYSLKCWHFRFENMFYLFVDWSKLIRNIAAAACCAGTHKNIGFCSLHNPQISHSNSNNAYYE